MLLVFLFFFFSFLFVCRSWRFLFRIIRSNPKIGFLHPFCNSGGGGERVLWVSLQALQKSGKLNVFDVAIYSGENATNEEILKNTRDKFSVELNMPIEFVKLHFRFLMLPKYYPVFTLLGQAIGGMLMALEGLIVSPCDIFIDTTGIPFIYPVAKYLFGIDVVTYTHYPFISADMIGLVKDRVQTYNNRALYTSSFLSPIKVFYYKFLAYIYGLVGRSANIVMVNSSWTRDHINLLFKRKIDLVYPPCPLPQKHVSEVQKRKEWIISVSQFRPEKNHELQIKAFSIFHPSRPNSTLILIGGCRNEDDYARVTMLKSLAESLKIDKHVKFELNVSLEVLEHYYSTALVALHTMRNEHFGISCVECQSRGVILIANDSAGPRMDIVGPNQEFGFLADTAEDYSDKLKTVFSWYDKNDPKMLKMKKDAKLKSEKFSDDAFEKNFILSLHPVLNKYN